MWELENGDGEFSSRDLYFVDKNLLAEGYMHSGAISENAFIGSKGFSVYLGVIGDDGLVQYKF